MIIILKLNNDWQKIKYLLKAKYPVLTDNDLSFRPDEEDNLVEKISMRLKMDPEDVRAMLLKMKFMEISLEADQVA